MSTLMEAYERSYAQKNKAIEQQLKIKKATLKQEQQRVVTAGENQMRQAYAEYMRAVALKDQQSRAGGRFGGAAENVKNGLGVTHRAAQEKRLSETKANVAELDEQILAAEASAQKSIAGNKAALQLKKDQAEIKAAQEAAKAAEKAKSSSGKTSSSKSSSGGLTNSQVISLMKMGIYDASFAGILGISDDEVRTYIKNGGKSTTSSDAKLPGTYKPPLR